MSNFYIDDGPAVSGQKVMLATTAYDSLDAGYTFSLQRSREALTSAGIQSAYLLLSGNCHVDDARNSVIELFLSSDCTDLVFIDADVSWSTEALVELCEYPCDLVGGVYPYRRPHSGQMPVLMTQGVHEPKDGLVEVEGLPSGFMRMRRVVPETLAKKANRYQTNRASDVPVLFERKYIEGTRIGGDINFCIKWRAEGGKVHAAYEMQLGHTGKITIKDSLGAGLRRQSDTTLRHVASLIRNGDQSLDLLTEARTYCKNPYYGATEDTLALAVLMARKADGPILEIGSGLSTILMAAANPHQTVYCLEHDLGWAEQVKAMAYKAWTRNIAICTYNLVDGFYDVTDELPKRFSLGFHDGPPRGVGKRMKFFDTLAERCDALVIDDTDDPGYAKAVSEWAAKADRQVDFVERAALIRRSEDVRQETLQVDRRQTDEAVGRHGRGRLVQDESRGIGPNGTGPCP